MRVLLIEDDPTTAHSIELMLKSDNFKIDITDLGEEGIDLGKLYDYDIILLDIDLPDMSGYEVLKNLRTQKIDTPVLILTGHASTENKVKGLALGGADLSASLGSTMDWDSLLYARSKMILEAAINNLFSNDSPFMDIQNLEALGEESKKAKALGFNGKAAIHPGQLEVITNSFLPNEEEISEAKEIIKAFNQSSSAVIAFNGRMIDQPIILSLEKRLRLVGIDPKNID